MAVIFLQLLIFNFISYLIISCSMDVSPLIPDPSFLTALKHFESIVVQIDDKKTYEKALR